MSDAATIETTEETPATPPAEAPPANDNDTPAEPKEAEKADAKDKKDEPAPPVLSKLERAKAAAEKAKRDHAARVKLQQAQAQQSRMLAERERELAQLREERARMAAQLEKADKDPLGYLREKGTTADVLARRAIEDASPDAKMRRLEEMVAAEREARIKAEQAREEQARQAQQQAAISAARDAFVKKAGDVEKYPSLARHAEVRPQGIIREAEEILADAYKKTGMTYSDDEVLEYLESVYSKAHGSPSAKAGATKAATETRNGAGAQETTTAGKPRTLTAAASQKGALPPDWDELSDAEQKKAMAEMYRSLASRG